MTESIRKVNLDGTTEWKLPNGLYHRENGPAITSCDRKTKAWYINGKLHREDGPAFISDTEKRWYVNGVIHREDGPAIEYQNGDDEWYINGKKFSFEEFLKADALGYPKLQAYQTLLS